MTCEEVRQTILEKRPEECTNALCTSMHIHIAKCRECRIFLNPEYADGIPLGSLSDAMADPKIISMASDPECLEQLRKELL